MKKQTSVKKDFGPAAVILTAVLVLYVLSLVICFVWGFFASLKEGFVEFEDNVFGLPRSWKWSNYLTVLNSFKVPVTIDGVNKNIGMLNMISNSVLYAVGCAGLQTFVTCVVGYCLSKFKNKFSSFMLGLVIVVFSIPIVGSDISMIRLLKNILNLYDSIFALFLMAANFTSIYLLVFVACFNGISDTYAEAAHIDGADEFTIFFRIYLYLAKSMFLTVFLILFIGRWNDYNVPLLYMPNVPTLSYGVYYLTISTDTVLSLPPMRIAASMILVIPILILFLIFNKRIMGGIAMGGIKE